MQNFSFQDIIGFWFEEIEESQWWVKDKVFDQLITDRFGSVHGAANRCELFEWRESALGRLAEVIVLDQFSRNIYRDDPRSFASDPLALCLAQEAVGSGFDKVLLAHQRNFIYMPYMHSESKPMHELAVSLFESSDSPQALEFELKHKRIIDRFGRYPHRNDILGRESSDEERAFLEQEDARF